MLDFQFYKVQRDAERLRTASGGLPVVDIYGVKVNPITGEITSHERRIIANCSPFTLDTARNTATRNGYEISGIIARGLFRTAAGLISSITLY